jgi:hypothetical protein
MWTDLDDRLATNPTLFYDTRLLRQDRRHCLGAGSG